MMHSNYSDVVADLQSSRIAADRTKKQQNPNHKTAPEDLSLPPNVQQRSGRRF
jgi:hypothetical protein